MVGIAGEFGRLQVQRIAGKADDLPEKAFSMVGNLDEAREKAEKLKKEGNA